MKLNLGSGDRPLPGFENLDKQTGWRFEDGLPYDDDSVEAITISHALMYVAEEDWPFVFSEIARTLEPGGVLRVTEDWTDNPESERYGGFPGAVTLTSPSLVWDHVNACGLDPRHLGSHTSEHRDGSLIQRWHGDSPRIFHVEGVKP